MLHSKADIAAELAFRDMEIAKLTKELTLRQNQLLFTLAATKPVTAMTAEESLQADLALARTLEEIKTAPAASAEPDPGASDSLVFTTAAQAIRHPGVYEEAQRLWQEEDSRQDAEAVMGRKARQQAGIHDRNRITDKQIWKAVAKLQAQAQARRRAGPTST